MRHIHIKKYAVIFGSLKLFVSLQSIFADIICLKDIICVDYITYNPSHKCRVIYNQNIFFHNLFPLLEQASFFINDLFYQIILHCFINCYEFKSYIILSFCLLRRSTCYCLCHKLIYFLILI